MKGIFFIEPLFNAVVDGIKTQTRVFNNYIEDVNRHYISFGYTRVRKMRNGHFRLCNDNLGSYIDYKSKYRIGETLYLKEPYYNNIDERIDYSFTTQYFPYDLKNKLYIPESSARYFIEITDIRFERLHEISESDCIKEGISNGVCSGGSFWGVKYKKEYTHYSETAHEAYANIFDIINGKGTWDNNPYIWVYDFKLKTK